MKRREALSIWERLDSRQRATATAMFDSRQRATCNDLTGNVRQDERARRDAQSANDRASAKVRKARKTRKTRTWLPLDLALARASQCTGSSGPVTIYGLVDPWTRTVRYIGKTEKPIEQRVAEHMANPTNDDMWFWLGLLSDVGQKPEPVILQRCGFNEWRAAERAWIFWAAGGWRIYNRDPGGTPRDSDGRLTETGKDDRLFMDTITGRTGRRGGLPGRNPVR